MTILFANPWALAGAWAAPVFLLVWLAVRRRSRRTWAAHLSPELCRKLLPPESPRRAGLQAVLLAAGLLLALLAAARPQWGVREERVRPRGRDLMIALDVSRSMLAQDAHPNRLQRAKADILDLLRALQGDRAGLIAFRGKAVQVCPLTSDYAFLEQALQELSPDSAPRGATDVGDALDKALAACESDETAHQAVILISDGEDLAGRALEAADRAAARGIVVFTVGLGDAAGARIPGGAAGEFLTYQGQAVISKLQHETLQAIAERTGGVYVPVGTANVKLDRLYSGHLSKLAAREREESLQQRHIERYAWFLLPALLAFLAAALLSRGRLAARARPAAAARALRASGLAALLAAAPGAIQAQTSPPPAAGAARAAAHTRATNGPAARPSRPAAATAGRTRLRQAQTLFRQGRYDESAAAYLDTLPGLSADLKPQALFNAGCALLAAGRNREAADQFAELAALPGGESASAHYNSGCALLNLSEQAASGTNPPPDRGAALLAESGESLRRAMRLQPDAADAIANLNLVTNRLPAARAEAKLAALLARTRGVPPAELADRLMQGQRRLLGDLAAAETNAEPSRIGQLEALAARQREQADLLIPIQAALAETAGTSTGGAARAAAVLQHAEAVRSTMNQAAEQMRDLDPDAFRQAARAESGLYPLWKGLAGFPQLLREAIALQTNSIALAGTPATDSKALLEQQREARELTGLFASRFEQAVPPGGTSQSGSAQGDAPTNGPGQAAAPPGLDTETRAAILDLAGQAVRLQEQALARIEAGQPAEALPSQRSAHDRLIEIREKLPKDSDKRPQPQDQQEQQQKDRQQDQEQQQKPEKQEEAGNPQADQQPKPEPEPEPQQTDAKPEDGQQQPEAEPEPATDKEPGPEESSTNMTPAQARAILEKAAQREKERRDQRERNAYLPLSPLEQDW